MSSLLPQVYYVGACTAILASFLLWVLARFNVPAASATVKFAVFALALGVCFIPIAGLPVWRLVFALRGNPSVPLLGLVAAALGSQVFGVTWFSAAERRTVWWFGAVVGTLLYFHIFVPAAWDLYFWGWEPMVFDLALAALAIVFLGLGHRFGVLLAGALIASGLGLLESANGWDYVVDPFFWLVSLGVVTGRVFRRIRGGWGPAVPVSPATVELEPARSA